MIVMDRRTFIQATPAVAAGAVLGTPSVARADETGGFRLISEEQFEWVVRNRIGGDPPPCRVHHYVVDCPYPAESYAWLSIVAHKEGQVWVATDDEKDGVVPITKPRRVIFPRVLEGADGLLGDGNSPEGRILGVYEAVLERGFDNVKPQETEWKVVWVEFRCSDGRREHIIAGLPISWASELPLNVLVSTQIA